MPYRCPACAAEQATMFYSLERIPVHSVRLLWNRDEALQFSGGKMDLTHCPTCGFIFNQSYDPSLQDYSAEYESTQAYSSTFNAFARRLAQQLIDRYDLHGKSIIEIGCGQGEFLSLMCELGNNNGIGFDPAYDPSRALVTSSGSFTIIPDYYSEQYSGYHADFVACKMTLEHIRDVAGFIGSVRRSIGSQNTTVFFQVPDMKRVLDELAFWDVYYEHCSYFTLGSLARLFRSQGFEVNGLWRDYGDQYIMVDARPAPGPTTPRLPEENDMAEIAAGVARFQERVPRILSEWKSTVTGAIRGGQKVVLWGSGSKGVAFLTTLGLCDEITYTVDINPNKHGTFMASTGQQVVSPQFLEGYRPDLVILMNPLYQDEVREDLEKRGLSPRIVSVGG